MPKRIYERKSLTKVHKQHIGDALRGCKHSEEHNKKVSEALKGRKHSEEVQRRRIESQYKYSEEAKQNMSESHKGLFIGEDNPNWKGGREQSKKREQKNRRNFGFIPINENFMGAEGHHIDRDFVIYIPIKLHQSIPHSVVTGKNLKEINDAAFAYTYREDRI